MVVNENLNKMLVWYKFPWLLKFVFFLTFPKLYKKKKRSYFPYCKGPGPIPNKLDKILFKGASVLLLVASDLFKLYFGNY